MATGQMLPMAQPIAASTAAAAAGATAPPQNICAYRPRVTMCAPVVAPAVACPPPYSPASIARWTTVDSVSAAAISPTARAEAPLSAAATANAPAPTITAWTIRCQNSSGDCHRSRPSAWPKRNAVYPATITPVGIASHAHTVNAPAVEAITPICIARPTSNHRPATRPNAPSA